MERQLKPWNRLSRRAASAVATGMVTILLILTAGFTAFGKTLPSLPPAGAPDSPDAAEGGKTLSPYFFVRSDDPTTDQLPLKATTVAANIAGVIADVKVTQVYRNEGRRTLEAIYIFPASTRAAVYGMKMTIGERTITAVVKKREEARGEYERAKQEGRSASLLEQQRPNVFQMNVANILPGDEIKTELHYTELITPTAGIYEFVYPTVVGPRYSNPAAGTAPPSQRWSQNPYLHQGEPPPYTFHITARLTPGVPIQEMICTSHAVDIRYENPSRATATLGTGEEFGGNRDFILRYRLAGEAMESGLLLYEGKEENFFILSMQPPGRVVPGQIPPREYIFIVDVSGSMHGFPLETSKRLMHELLAGMRSTDTFNVLLFSGGSTVLAPQSLPATPENVRKALEAIDRQQGGGGTELIPALKRALALPHREGIARTVVIATDGYVAVEPEAFELIRRELGKANFFAFGIGSSVNRFLIEGMARAGSGEPFIITHPGQAAGMAERFREYIQAPVLTQIRLDFGTFEAYDVEPAAVPDVFAERPVTVFGKWRGTPGGSITLRGLSGRGAFEKTIHVPAAETISDSEALRYLWARTRVAQLADDNRLQANDRLTMAITDLALKYGLLTACTSFVAVDTRVRGTEGQVTTVTQPLPLPEGVSDLAVGSAAPAAARMLSIPAGVVSEGMKIHAADSNLPYGKTDAKGLRAKEETSGKGRDDDTTRWKLSILKIAVRGGGLSEESAKRTTAQHLDDLKDRCFRFPGAMKTAQFDLEWTVDASGYVGDVKILSPQTAFDGLELCLRSMIGTWQFPASTGNRSIRISISFAVEPDEP